MVSISIEDLTRTYLNLRTERSILSKEYKDKDAELIEAQEKVKAALLQHCDEQGLESVKTSEGLVYKTTTEKYWTYDWERMHEFILEHRVPELLDRRINQKHLREFLEDNPELLPKGLNKTVDVSVTVRKPTR
jgi:predicted metal-dependent phosphotriesterase family hydrolase